MTDEDSMVPPMQPSAEARIVGKANLSVLEHAASNGGDASGFRLDFLTNCHMRDAVTEAYRDGYNAAITEDAMPSEMVPAQQLSDAGEDLVRLAAAKDAEIAALTLDRDAAMDTARGLEKHYTEWREQHAAQIEGFQRKVVALTEQRDAAQRERDTNALWNQRHREQRDRALEAVEMARRAAAALNIALAALDTQSSPSLPESP